MYIVITTDREVTEHEGLPDLDRLQAIAGGDVETIGLNREGIFAVMWFGEDGKRASLDVNEAATYIAQMWAGISPNDFVVGPVILTGSADEEGDTTPLSRDWRQYVRDLPIVRAWNEPEPGMAFMGEASAATA